MGKIDIDSLNMLKFSHAHIGDLPFSVYWVSASNGHNTGSLKNHHHTFCELHVLMDGYVEYIVGDRRIRLEQGQFLCIPSQCVHRVDGCSTEFVKLTVAFDVHQPLPPNIDLVHPCRMSDEMIVEATRLFTNASIKSVCRAELTLLAVSGLILRAAEIIGVSLAASKEEECDDRVLKAKLLMQDNPAIFFTCEELARYCHVSAKQLGRLFRKYEGKGLLEYIHAQKIETTKRMLLETDLPQKVMAERLGFSDYRYYAHFFSRMTGMTPSEYKHRDIEDDD